MDSTGLPGALLCPMRSVTPPCTHAGSCLALEDPPVTKCGAPGDRQWMMAGPSVTAVPHAPACSVINCSPNDAKASQENCSRQALGPCFADASQLHKVVSSSSFLQAAIRTMEKYT